MEGPTGVKLFDLNARARFWSDCLIVANSLDSPNEADVDLF